LILLLFLKFCIYPYSNRSIGQPSFCFFFFGWGSPINLSTPPGREILLQVQRPLEETHENSAAMVAKQTCDESASATNLDPNSHKTCNSNVERNCPKNAQESRREIHTPKQEREREREREREMRINFMTSSANVFTVFLSVNDDELR
jgi:hypothetical protein